MSDRDPSDRPDARAREAEKLTRDRYELLQRLEDWLEAPMLVLPFVWLVLLVVVLVRGESPLPNVLGTLIWVVFILDSASSWSWPPARSTTSDATG